MINIIKKIKKKKKKKKKKKRKLLRKIITRYLSDESSNYTNIEKDFINNDLILSKINNKKFDILVFTIENIKHESESVRSLIKFIYDKFQYKNINYTFVHKNFFLKKFHYFQ